MLCYQNFPKMFVFTSMFNNSSPFFLKPGKSIFNEFEYLIWLESSFHWYFIHISRTYITI